MRIFDEFFSGFRAKFQKIVTCVAVSIKFAKTNQKFAESSEFSEKNSLLFNYYSKLFTSLLTGSPAAADVDSALRGQRAQRRLLREQRVRAGRRQLPDRRRSG